MNTIKTNKILNTRKLLKLTRILNNNALNNNSGNNSRTIKNNQVRSNGQGLETKRVILAYSVVPDKKTPEMKHTFLNWCALLNDRKHFHDIRPYKQLDTKHGIEYPMTIAIYNLTKAEYEMLNKKNLADRKDFASIKKKLFDSKNPLKSKVITVIQSKGPGIMSGIARIGLGVACVASGSSGAC